MASWTSSQGARTALAHLLFRLGAREEAVETVRASLAIDFDAGAQDPWLRYRRTQFRSFDELLTGLRQEARQ